eukprot:TRINITY_DN32875_c0_g1_i4.p1 TRINITY_DN32875_c0_g1~~TRINITY_DN32875_c0_g1_i4.p1  ORF type:complete len:601 (+),score=43.12 TRINITY_DN32875_c0_g1_i4:499-2301(+)
MVHRSDDMGKVAQTDPGGLVKLAATTTYSEALYSESEPIDNDVPSSSRPEGFLPVSGWELAGWYLYNVAANAFSAVAMPIFIPLLLLLLADEQAWKDSGKDKPPTCDDSVAVDCLQCVAGKGMQLLTSSGYQDLEQPKLQMGVVTINPVSYATVVIGVAVVCQIFGLISLGPFTDFGRGRKQILTIGTILGVVGSTCLLAMVDSSLWWLAGVLVIVASMGYGLATVSYNAYLPVLVDASPEVFEAEATGKADVIVAAREKVENRISLIGLAAGCFADIPITLIAFALTLLASTDAAKMRLATFFCGVCWLLFGIFTIRWLHARPGPPLPVPVSSAGLGGCCGGYMNSAWDRVCFFVAMIGASWRNMGLTLVDAWRHYRNAFIFVLCYFVYADGFSTIIQVGVIFGQRELCVPPAYLAILATSVSFWAVLGMPVAYFLQKWTKWSNKTMAMVFLGGMLPLPLWGLIGYLTPEGTFGLKATWELFVYVGWFGFCLGPLLSYSRTLYVDLMPAGKEGAFFALYTISDKGSSSFGPFVVAIIAQFTGQIRPTFIYIFCCMFIPLVVVSVFLNHKQGIEDSGRIKAVVKDTSLEEGKGSYLLTGA